MKAVLTIVAALIAAVLIATLGTLSFVKSQQASESKRGLGQALARVTEQKAEIDALKAQIEDLHEKMRLLQAKLSELNAGGNEGVGQCPAAAAPVAVETPDGGRTPLGIRYVAGVLKVLNTGASLRVTAASGGRLQIGAEMYDLRFIHLVRPEGGLLNGRPVALAAHLVHSTASGEQVVVSVPLRESAFQNRTIWLILNNVPAPDAPEASIANISIDPNQLLPENRGYEVFRGSLPFQPCSANVRFYQFTNPVGVSKDQVERFLARVKAPAIRSAAPASPPSAGAPTGPASAPTAAPVPASAPRRAQP